MKKSGVLPIITGVITGLITGLIVIAAGLFFSSTAINIHNPVFWIIIIIALFTAILAGRIAKGCKDFGWVTVSKKTGSKGRTKKHSEFRFSIVPYIPPVALAVIIIGAGIVGSTMFNATSYAKILKVDDSDFTADLSESVETDSIALMDTASARMLGDREIGALSDVVSQFDVSDDYIQIDYNGKPVKVSALEYAGFFKWMNNKEGVRGYVTVDPVSMSATFEKSEGMKYVPSAYFLDDAKRHIWLEYPTLMTENLHFEIDANGKPYYVATIVDKTISLFGGKTVNGCIVLDPVSGETVRYDVADIPRWIDVVFHGDLICEQYNWYGMYQNGYMNSLFAKKGCKQVTTYSSDDNSDEKPVSDYGYVAKDGDIWIYTGVTSVNGDSSNIGFLLANERTGECRYYAIAGADEKSAMVAAEGEVQEKGYQASFPSLINIEGNPTYIMVLKDSGGLVKLYATVNVEQYNIVTTAATQAECIEKYKAMLGISDVQTPTDEIKNVTVAIASVKYIDIDGNTYIYLIDTENNIFKAKASENENMLLLEAGDTVELSCSDSEILSCRQIG
ncbi:MAG: hypothetical protein IJ289_09660 [Clostridia bacterium]|nr:hypothetical protein [Clostridia bacterium]